MKSGLDQCIVTIPSVDSLRCIKPVVSFKLHIRDRFNDVRQSVDRDELVRADVDWFNDVTLHQFQDTSNAIVDVHEAASLPSVAPNLDRAFLFVQRFEHFPTDRGGRFFSTAGPRTMRTIDVVETSNAWLVFCNFGVNNADKYLRLGQRRGSAFSPCGRFLSFQV